MKKLRRVITFLLAVLTLTSMLTVSAQGQVETAFDTALTYYKTAFESEVSGKADVWQYAILVSAGKTDDPDYAFMVPKVNADELTELTAPAVYAKSIMSLILMEQDPTDYAGRNLVEELCGRQAADGSFTNTYGTEASDSIFSIIALQMAAKQGYKLFYDANLAVDALIKMRHSDNGFNDYGDAGDVDLTGMAMMALALADTEDGRRALEDAVAYMESRLDADGNLVSAGLYGSANANSQAYGIIGLIAAGEDLASEKWLKNGKTLVDVLLSYQDADGGFWYDMAAKNGENEWSTTPNEMSTYQALLALADVSAGENFWAPLAEKITQDDNQSSTSSVFIQSSSTASVSSASSGSGSRVINPKTGDTGINPLVIILIVVAAVVIILLICIPIFQKKRKNKDDPEK